MIEATGTKNATYPPYPYVGEHITIASGARLMLASMMTVVIGTNITVSAVQRFRFAQGSNGLK